nr:WG repeat-containing protein [uncultured Capnocytophaga sp.]
MDLSTLIGLFADYFGECINRNITPNPIEGATIEREYHNGIQHVAYRTGQYNIVFKIKKDGKYYALRIPTGGGEISSEDLNAIANYIKYNPLPYFVDFSYIAQGIELEDGKYKDAIVMEWVEGQTLDHYIEAHKSDPQELKRIASEFLKMIKCFHQRGIAHGDLQEGNIIIGVDGYLKLVDYDSMYIPGFAGKNEVIKGKEGYQHNSRINNFTNKQTEKVDYFSELVIYLSLQAIAEKPSLWKGIGENGLIFTQADFNMPFRENSTYKKLMALSAEVRELTEILVRYIETELYTNLIPFYEYIPRIKYDYISDYSEDLAIVRLNNKYGVIDRKGREIVPTIYEYITDYRKGWAIVRLAGGEGSWIDTKGTIIPLEEHPLCKQASPEKEKEKTQEKSDNNSRDISSQKKESSSLIEKTQPQNLKRKNLWIAGILAIVIGIGFWLIKGNSEEDMTTQKEIVHIEEELYPVEKLDPIIPPIVSPSIDTVPQMTITKLKPKDNIDNISDKIEEENLKYGDQGNFREGFAWVRTAKRHNGYYLYGFIDEKGKEITPLKYEWVSPFRNGMAKVYQDHKYGFIDTTGKEVIPLKYDAIGEFLNGVTIVQIGGKQAFINKFGEELTPFYDEIGTFSKDGIVKVRLGKKEGLVYRTGEILVPLTSQITGYIVTVKINGKEYRVLVGKKEIVNLSKYDYAYDFSEGLACVRLNNEYGFIDGKGKDVVPFIYDYADDFSEGLARVKLNNKWGFIDKTGKEAISFKYDYAHSFFKGFGVVSINRKYGVINSQGKELIPLEYEDIRINSEDQIVGYINGKEVYMDGKGRCIQYCENAQLTLYQCEEKEDFKSIENKFKISKYELLKLNPKLKEKRIDSTTQIWIPVQNLIVWFNEQKSN